MKNRSERQIVVDKSIGELFKERVSTALRNQRVEANEMVEFYLVNLLVEFAKSEVLFDRSVDIKRIPLALVWAKAMKATLQESIRLLKKIGDTSLYMSGYFYESIDQQMVNKGYFINMGENAYLKLSQRLARLQGSHDFSQLYRELSLLFSDLVEVLAEVSERSTVKTNKGLLKLYHRWFETQDERIARSLATRGVIVTDPDDDSQSH